MYNYGTQFRLSLFLRKGNKDTSVSKNAHFRYLKYIPLTHLFKSLINNLDIYYNDY